MKKSTAFLISGIIFLGTIRLLRKLGNGLPLLSSREKEILNLMAEGYPDDEIAECLEIDQRSLGRYIHNILNRLYLPDISHAIAYALERGLVSITYA